VKGQSGNPKGRPRTGLALAERIRERLDPDIITDLAERVAADETLSPQARIEILIPVYDRGFLKPPTTFAGKVETSSTTPKRDWSQVPLEERRALLAQLRGVQNPKVLDGDAVLLPAIVAPATSSTDEE
jgi:hypothetical protein